MILIFCSLANSCLPQAVSDSVASKIQVNSRTDAPLAPCWDLRTRNSGNLEALFQVLEDVPNEICDLVPQRVCNQVTKLVPRLVPKRKCVDEPNEICVR